MGRRPPDEGHAPDAAVLVVAAVVVMVVVVMVMVAITFDDDELCRACPCLGIPRLQFGLGVRDWLEKVSIGTHLHRGLGWRRGR